jgi:hypothetical protein
MSFLEKAIPLGLSDQDIYVCPPTQSGSVHGLVLSNTSGATATFKIKLFSQASGLTTPITSDVASLAAGAMFVWPKPINMIAGDRIIASASVANAIVALASVYIATANPVSSGFNPRGSWSSNATYNVNDVVSYDGDSYIAVTQSVNSVPPSANWMMSARKGDVGIVARGTWNGATTYNPNEVVMSPIDHNLYIATQMTLGDEPSTNPIYWQLLLQNDSVGAAAVSAANAAVSASSAATSATTATTQATNASSSATAASTSATSANNSAAAAAASQTSAASSATSATASASTATTSAATATTQAGNAAASATSAATSATSATASQNKAAQWADADLNVQVESGKYSAKHWAMTAQATVTGSLVYRGSWDASSGAYPSSPALGNYYKISVAGTMGGTQFSIGDSMIFNGTDWDKIDSTDQVTSVAGRQGAVVLTKSDVGLSNVDDVSDINKPISTAQQTALNAKQDTSGKDASNGYAGLTLFKLNLRNAANTVTSWFTTAATAARTWTMPDKDGTVAMTSDLTSASISNAPAGNITSTTVQNAINELDAKKAKLAGDASQTFAVANATLSNQAVNLSQLGSYNQVIADFATGTLPSTCWGGIVQVRGGATVTLPTTNPPSGSKVVLFVSGTQGFTVASNSNQYIYAPQLGLNSTTGPTSFAVVAGGWIELISRGNGEYDVTGGSSLIFQNTAPAFTNPLVVPNATASNQAVNWAQAGTQILSFSTSGTVTPTAFNTLVFTSFSAAGTITVNPGAFTGQRVRVYGCGYPATTKTNVTSGSPFLAFPDGSTSYALTIANSLQYIEMVWDTSNWRCTTAGQAFVAAATQSGQAVNLGQLSNASISANFSGLAVTQNVTSLPANYDTDQVKLLQATTPTAGVSFSSGDSRILTAGLGPNGPFIRASSNPLDLTSNAGVLVPNAAAANQAVNYGQSISGATIKNLTTSRSVGVVYTNSSSRAISVQCSGSVLNAGDALMLAVGGISVYGSSAATNTQSCTVASIVPPNATYELASVNNGIYGVNTVYSWVEVS